MGMFLDRVLTKSGNICRINMLENFATKETDVKQIVVVTSSREKREPLFRDHDFFITWCPFSVEELIKVRHRSNVFGLFLDDEDSDTLSRMGLYLRDLCLEDEKMLYLCGTKEEVKEFKSLVPAMFIKKSINNFSLFEGFMETLLTNEVKPHKGRPTLTIIDDDAEYIERLRVHLDEFFQVCISDFSGDETKHLISLSDVALISVDGMMKISDFMGLLRMVLRKKKESKFRFYYLTPTDKDRIVLNAESENISLSVSKEMDVDRVAKFLISQYS